MHRHCIWSRCSEWSQHSLMRMVHSQMCSSREILFHFSCAIIFLKAIEPNSTVTTQHDQPEPEPHTCCHLTADTAQWSHISTRPNKKSRRTFLKVHQTTCFFLNLIQNSNRVIQPDLPAMWHLPLPALLLANMEKSNQDFIFIAFSVCAKKKISSTLGLPSRYFRASFNGSFLPLFLLPLS